MNRQLMLVVMIMAVLLPAVGTLAQGGPGGPGDEFRRTELERTDQLIERALEMVRGVDNPTAAGLVEQARQLQARAWEHYSAGEPVRARYYSEQARELLKKALNQARHSEQTESMVLRHLERAKEKLDKAADLMSGSDNRSILAIYESARDNLARAWEFYNDKQYRPALKLADQVEKATEKVLNSIDKGADSDSSYERRRETVQAAIERAREAQANCNSTNGLRLLQQAENAYETADKMAGKKSWNAAMQALQRARDLAVKSARECQGGELLQARYERYLAQANRLKELSLSLSGQTREVVDRLLLQAYDQLALASAHIQANEDDKATAAIQAASLALRQAEMYIKENS